MRIYKQIASAFLLLAQLIVITFLSGRLYAQNYYNIKNVNGNPFYFSSPVPLNLEWLRDNFSLDIESVQSNSDSPVRVYEFSGGMVPSTSRSATPEARSLEYSRTIAPVLRVIQAQSAHDRFRQTSLPAPESPTDSHIVRIYITLPGSSHVTDHMNDVITIAQELVQQGVADRWHAEESAFISPNRPVLSLSMYVDRPHQVPEPAVSPADPPADLNEVITEESGRNWRRCRRLGSCFSQNFRRLVFVDSNEVTTQESNGAYFESPRTLDGGLRLQFNVERDGMDSAESIRQIINTFRRRAENARVGFTESFSSNGAVRNQSSGNIRFFSPYTPPPINWMADGDEQLHAIREQVVEQLRNRHVYSAGSPTYEVENARNSEAGLFSRRHFMVTIPLSIVSGSEGDDDVVNVARRSLQNEVGAIRTFLESLTSNRYAGLVTWNYHDVNYAPDRHSVEVSFIFTNYVDNNRVSTSSVGLPHLNSNSPNHWQIRQWMPVYIASSNQQIVFDREQRAALCSRLGAFLVFNLVRRPVRWIRERVGSAGNQQPDVELELESEEAQRRLLQDASRAVAGPSGVNMKGQ
ncbi:hypothetical protein [Endozoicomonas euniceicola]|uniref:Uncharacterized protein n=1 Tax=Endozoicomonas euniceicola TaxID=1234143 RepID=A0ABY6GWH6_9GAMM|nr:hypothetical protein [Endozoicomonas euniceicola]UYM17125.1 hypothetical protein NX720_04160 [Endozoicomonas euniceicola]